jgi:hypothetical protein
MVPSKRFSYDFLTGGEKFLIMRREGPKWRNRHKWEFWHKPGLTVEPSDLFKGIGPLGFRELDEKGRIERRRREAHVSRFSMALFGGAALISPMLIMALNPGLVVDLVTTSVATVAFAIIVAVFLRDASGEHVLASTAAYTAVLVVFVGASLAPTPTA